MNPNYPKISIITPSYNQAQFLEETIQSVLGQNYPNLEYWIIDGGSTDGTLEILKKYNGQIKWISEPDHGQTHAINKGLQRATGEIVAFLNSDDIYEPGALFAVGRYFLSNRDAVWLSGRCLNVDEFGCRIRSFIQRYKNFWLRLNSYPVLLVLNYISQPATFWRRSALQKVGYLNEDLHYTMDYEYWLRLGKEYRLNVLNRDLASFRIHGLSKSGTTPNKQFDEELKVAKFFGNNNHIFLHKLHRFITVTIYEKLMRLGPTLSIEVNEKFTSNQ